MSSLPPGGKPPGPPYASPNAITGGIPTTKVDVPISAILLAFFVGSATLNMTIFQINRRRGHKFLFSAMLFGFSFTRVIALVMRIVWANYPTNTSIALAAQIFVAAGVLLLFVVNLIFTQRIVRSYHPHFGWNKTVSLIWKGTLWSVLGLLVMVIVANVHSQFTLDLATRLRERDVLRFAAVYLAVMSFLPIPIVITAVLWPRSKEVTVTAGNIEKFGRGRMRTKVRLVLFASTLLALGASFRAGTSFLPRPAGDPAWYHSRAAFYCFNFVIELVVVYTYAISRFDRRFHIPNGAHGAGSYAGAVKDEEDVFGSGEEGREDKGEQPDLEAHLPNGTTLAGSEHGSVEKETIEEKAVSAV
ncbi:hypothetical protein QBC43DRAFT_341546 [Cladorrhinum sp. PSN259]|nr:hypothetical protein QBC43DRAFT_341546 [Cladorrhinum sp. PSN259]